MQSRPQNASGTTRRSGFTLIELLIVIAIIGTLAALITSGITKVRGKAAEAQASNDISTVMVAGINSYQSDMGFYPAFNKNCDDDEVEEFNAFPELFEALCGEKPPEGRGGKNAPYAELKAESIMVEDEDAAIGYSPADNDELYDPDIEKFYIDPWGFAYVYRENGSKKKRKDWMIKRSSFDLWSIGPNGVNEACYGRDAFEEEGFDDIGNW